MPNYLVGPVAASQTMTTQGHVESKPDDHWEVGRMFFVTADDERAAAEAYAIRFGFAANSKIAVVEMSTFSPTVAS